MDADISKFIKTECMIYSQFKGIVASMSKKGNYIEGKRKLYRRYVKWCIREKIPVASHYFFWKIMDYYYSTCSPQIINEATKVKPLPNLPSTQKTKAGHCYIFIVSKVRLNKFILNYNRTHKKTIQPILPRAAPVEVRKLRRKPIDPAPTVTPKQNQSSIVPLESDVPTVTPNPEQNQTSIVPLKLEVTSNTKHNQESIVTVDVEVTSVPNLKSDKNENILTESPLIVPNTRPKVECGTLTTRKHQFPSNSTAPTRLLKIERKLIKRCRTVTPNPKLAQAEPTTFEPKTPEFVPIENKDEDILTKLAITTPEEQPKTIPRVTLKLRQDPIDGTQDNMPRTTKNQSGLALKDEGQKSKSDSKPSNCSHPLTEIKLKKVKGYKRNMKDARKNGRLVKPHPDSKNFNNKAVIEELARLKKSRARAPVRGGKVILEQPKVEPTTDYYACRRRHQKAKQGKKISDVNSFFGLKENDQVPQVTVSTPTQKTPCRKSKKVVKNKKEHDHVSHVTVSARKEKTPCRRSKKVVQNKKVE